MRYIESDENFVMRGKPLQDAIDDDIQQGLIPFWVSAFPRGFSITVCVRFEAND